MADNKTTQQHRVPKVQPLYPENGSFWKTATVRTNKGKTINLTERLAAKRDILMSGRFKLSRQLSREFQPMTCEHFAAFVIASHMAPSVFNHDWEKNAAHLNTIKTPRDSHLSSILFLQLTAIPTMVDEYLPATLTPVACAQPEFSREVKENLTPWGRLFSRISTMKCVDLVGPSVSIGRSEQCNIVIYKTVLPVSHITVSKRHCIITRNEEGLVIVQDLSKNGTYINGKLIGRGKSYIIENNDVISLGQKCLKVYTFKTLDPGDLSYLPTELQSKYFPFTVLGRGGCGEVRLVFEKASCNTYAIKKIPKAKYSSNLTGVKPLNHPSKIKTEIDILRKLSHRFVIRLEEYVETESDVFIVLEYMQGGELTKRIKSDIPMTETQIKQMFYQIVLGVKYLHDNGIVHRDLKPENVLLSTDGPNPVVKISDFGLSKMLDENSMMETICGTPHYVAPEVISSSYKNYGPKVDIWSLGVILYYMMCREFPFDAEQVNTLYRKIVRGDIKWNNWTGLSPTVRNLVMQMLTVDPDARIDIDGVLDHPWLSKDIPIQWYQWIGKNDTQDDYCPPSKRQRLNSDLLVRDR